MNIIAKIEQIRAIFAASSEPMPLILDLMRVKRANYRAKCRGISFEIQANTHEWYTIYENVIREDYFSDGISLAEGDTVIDIGANFGSFTVLASKKVGRTGRVIAFEPNPDVCERLKHNVAINALSNIEVRNEAVCGQDGEIVLLLQERSSLTTMFSNIDQRESNDVRPFTVKAAGIVPILRSLDRPVALLKIDCEGAEYDIFTAIDRDTMKNVRQIAMELHTIDGHSDREIVDKLTDFGFIVSNKYPMLFARRPN
jgi:FkbM family methyltransferase